MSCNPRHQGDEQRLIDITPIEMFPAGEVIQFVSKNSVTRGDKQLKQKFHAREP